MTDTSNSDHSNQPQTQDDQSSALGRSYGLSGTDADDSATGSAAGDASQNQQNQSQPNQEMPTDDNGMASDAMGSGAGSDMMDLDEEDDDLDAEMDDDDVDNSGVVGGR